VADPIRHVIQLMLENRSFDHFLGAVPGVDGVDANQPRFNMEGPGSAVKHAQRADAVRKMKPDPKHDHVNVMRQMEPGSGLPAMGGFVWDMALAHPKETAAFPQAMAFFSLGHLPALHQLAQAFCVCDRWFSSVPGPTWTNRFFAHSGTSQGWVGMPSLMKLGNLHAYDQTTVYDRLNERQVPWRIYYGDIPHSLLLKNQRKAENRKHYRPFDRFFSDAAAAKTDDTAFPAYVFIEPSYMPGGQNDQHPPHDVLKGDDLIGTVYSAIRNAPALWNSSLLVVSWDEHGGFYDHVPPPPAVPPDHKNQEGCDFTRYGVRTPALLISPHVNPGVFRPSQGVIDHTSVLKYLTDKHQLGPLGNRTASAASLAEAINTTPQDAARDASPAVVGMTPRSNVMSTVGVGAAADPAGEELNPNQLALIQFSRQLEAEIPADPAEVGLRTVRAAASPQAEIEVAKERVRLYLERTR
jgi:phospholipase C